MEEIIKKKMKVSDAEGWYIAESVRIMIEESIVDETTGEFRKVERFQIISNVGERLNAINIAPTTRKNEDFPLCFSANG